MELRKVATDGVALFEDTLRDYGFASRGELTAVRGYLKGVMEGSINQGQNWLAVPLMRLDSMLSVDEHKIIERIFEAGMCCDGQHLNVERDKSFTARTV